MPNWVYNNLTIYGSEKDVETFYDKATALHPETFTDGKVVMTTEPEFSFWNFVAPPKDAVDSGEYFGTHGYDSSNGKQLGNTDNNWYNFQNREWGTKWDACDVSAETTINKDGTAQLTINYSTAWSIPEPVMNAMVEQHPELRFEFSCEEEQGWGAEFSGESGELVLTKEWDIPNSHTDYVELGRDDSCICANDDDETEWYDDCPRPEQEFIVVVERTYKITARNAEQAWETALDEKLLITADAKAEPIEHLAWVKDETGKRIYPTLD